MASKSGAVRLVDWKRTKNLREKYSNPWRNMAAPLDHLPDAQGIKYRLQLNVYRFILEKYYGFVVSSMLVVCLHPDLEVPFVDEVPHMPQETCEIMALRRMSGTVQDPVHVAQTLPMEVVAGRLDSGCRVFLHLVCVCVSGNKRDSPYT